MIASMTGFARCETSGPWGSLICELRSVNHRFLECGFRLPEEVRSIEAELRQALGKELKRGKVDCTITLRAVSTLSGEINIDTAALQRLTAQLRQVGEHLPQQHQVNLMDLLRWPGIMREERASSEELLTATRSLFKAAITQLQECRAREGERLAGLLQQRCMALETGVRQVRARLPEIHERIRARWLERFAELKLQVDPERLEQEIAIALQRLDVDEELDRLDSHIAEFRRITAAQEPAGRRLDFLLQEVSRETNTLSAKSQDLDTTRNAVEMKVVIEQLREQIQNVE
jgi:uncharacterized protein (TIGR00255 family)